VDYCLLPDAWIQAGRFSGSNKFRLIDSAEVRSCLPIAAEEVISFARRHLTVESVTEGAPRQERWSIPLVAICEAVLNAIVHADYGQHVSPIRRAVFDDRIEVENFGPLPFGPTIEDILAALRELGSAATAAIAKQVGLSPRATLTRLKALLSRGLVVEIATGPHHPKRQYALATTGRWLSIPKGVTSREKRSKQNLFFASLNSSRSASGIDIQSTHQAPRRYSAIGTR
jgi:hypothetical protein